MSRGVLHTDRPEWRDRRSIRLKGYDYAGAGAYFVTICAQNRECLYGEIMNGKMVLNDAGRMVETVWDQLPIRFPHLELDEFIVMPNHIHGILVSHRRGEPCVRPDRVRPVSPGDQPSGNNDTSGDRNTQTGDHKDRPYMAPDTVGYRKLGQHNRPGEHKVRPYGRPGVRAHGTLPGTVGRVVQAFKSITTHEYVHGVKQYGWRRFNGKLWQRNYYEHVIRNEDELNRIREYITNNPAQWETDQENPNATDRRGEPCVRPIDVRPDYVRPIDVRPIDVRLVSRGDQPSGNNDTLGKHDTQKGGHGTSGDHNTQTGDHKDRPYNTPESRTEPAEPCVRPVRDNQRHPSPSPRRGEPCVRPIDDRPAPIRRRAYRQAGTDPWEGQK